MEWKKSEITWLDNKFNLIRTMGKLLRGTDEEMTITKAMGEKEKSIPNWEVVDAKWELVSLWNTWLVHSSLPILS